MWLRLKFQLTAVNCHGCLVTGEYSRTQTDKAASRDGHAPEVVPAEGDAKVSKAKPGRSAMKRSKSQGKSKATSVRSQRTSAPQTSGLDGGESEQIGGKSHRKSDSPVFLSPSESLTSNSSTALSSGRSNSLGQQGRESDSFADAAAAALASTAQFVKPSTSTVIVKKDETTSAKLSNAALKSLEAAQGSKASKASSRASAKSHSRSSSVAEWHDVELQSEAEDEAHHKAATGSRQSGPPPARGHASEAAEFAASESDNDSELGIVEGEQHGQHADLSLVAAHGQCCLLL